LRKYISFILVAVVLVALLIFIAVKTQQPNKTAQPQLICYWMYEGALQQPNKTAQPSGMVFCVAYDPSLDRPETRNYMVQGEASVIYLIQVLRRGSLRNMTIVNLSNMSEADLYLILASGEEKVEFSGRRMIVSASSSEGLAAAVDRLLLEISRNLSRGLDQKREYLVIVDPSSGRQFGIPWLGGLSLERALRVPVKGNPSEVIKLLRK